MDQGEPRRRAWYRLVAAAEQYRNATTAAQEAEREWLDSCKALEALDVIESERSLNNVRHSK